LGKKNLRSTGIDNTKIEILLEGGEGVGFPLQRGREHGLPDGEDPLGAGLVGLEKLQRHLGLELLPALLDGHALCAEGKFVVVFLAKLSGIEPGIRMRVRDKGGRD